MNVMHFSPGHGAPLRGFFAPWRALPSTSLRLQLLRAISASGGMWVLLFLATWVAIASLGLDRETPPRKRNEFTSILIPPENYTPLLPKARGGPAAASTPKVGTTRPVAILDVPLPVPVADPTTIPFDEMGAGPASSGPPVDVLPVTEPPPAFGGEVPPHDVEPVELVMIKPEYPELAKQAGVDGTVVIALLVGADGRVKDAHVTRSASPLLDRAALEALRRWVFRPALASGHPVALWVSETVKFTLHTVD
jgi:TonB family protein